MPDWTIRPAEAGDAPRLTACMRAAYAPYAALGALPPLTADYAEEITACQVWVAMVAREIVGGLVLVPADVCMQLANVAVHPEYGGMGIGKAMIGLAEEQAKRQGYTEIRLTTHAGMTGNIGLYQHLGWQVVDTTDTTVAMKKALTPGSSNNP
jgi:ribosomal protein S18 acetylase RimI-like enzyme